MVAVKIPRFADGNNCKITRGDAFAVLLAAGLCYILTAKARTAGVGRRLLRKFVFEFRPMTITTLPLTFLLLLLLPACGQIGPLYLPDSGKPPVHVPADQQQ